MTPINSVRYTTIAVLFLLAGCTHRVPVATVEVIDTSASITPRAEKAALDAVQGQIDHMQRGDRLVLIPSPGTRPMTQGDASCASPLPPSARPMTRICADFMSRPGSNSPRGEHLSIRVSPTPTSSARLMRPGRSSPCCLK